MEPRALPRWQVTSESSNPFYCILTVENPYFRLDEVTKASAYLWENMSDPAVAHSVEVNHAPFNRAFSWDGPVWTFFDQPEQKARQHRFGIAMQGVAALAPNSILKGMPFISGFEHQR